MKQRPLAFVRPLFPIFYFLWCSQERSISTILEWVFREWLWRCLPVPQRFQEWHQWTETFSQGIAEKSTGRRCVLERVSKLNKLKLVIVCLRSQKMIIVIFSRCSFWWSHLICSCWQGGITSVHAFNLRYTFLAFKTKTMQYLNKIWNLYLFQIKHTNMYWF